jgi:hypothetical protein
VRTLAADCKMKKSDGVAPILILAGHNRRNTICPRLSGPGAIGNNRNWDMRCVKQRCCRIADTYSVVAHATEVMLCACVSASSKFCVWELP